LEADLSLIATEGDEMELAGLLEALQSPRHGISLSRSAMDFIAYRKTMPDIAPSPAPWQIHDEAVDQL
jgi:hypothetical protein